MRKEHMGSRTYIAIGIIAGVFAGGGTLQAGLTPTKPGYAIKHQINGAWVGPIDLVSDSQLVAGSYSYDASYNSFMNIAPVALNGGPIGSAVYTQPAMPSGSTYAGGALATDGSYALSGQTGSPPDSNGLYPGRMFLTRISDGATSSLDVAGNWDTTARSGNFYLTAAAGTATGLDDNGYSGLYQVQQTGDTLTSLNLVLDIGAPSGMIVDDAAGNMVFSLGGNSALLGGGFNDLYRLTAAQVATGVAAGDTIGLAGSAADPLITGSALAAAAGSFFSTQVPSGGSLFLGLSDIVFGPEDNLIVGMSGYVYDSGFQWVRTIGTALLLDVTEDNGDYSATVADMLYTNTSDGGGSLAYRVSDSTLWVSADGNLYGVNVPEPVTAVMFGLTSIGLLRRRTRRRPIEFPTSKDVGHPSD